MVIYKKETSLFKMVLSLTPFNKYVDYMRYEKFITDFLNIRPSELSKITNSTNSDGSIFVKVKLVQKVTSCPFCHNSIKVHDYYDRKLTHSTFFNRKCTIIYFQRSYRYPQCGIAFRKDNPFIDSSEHITYETKFNILKDLKYLLTRFKKVFAHKHQPKLDNEPKYNNKLG